MKIKRYDMAYSYDEGEWVKFSDHEEVLNAFALKAIKVTIEEAASKIDEPHCCEDCPCSYYPEAIRSINPNGILEKMNHD